MTNPPFAAWNRDGADARFSDVGSCSQRANKFERRIKIRNAIEYAAGALVFVLFGGAAFGAVARSEMLIALSMAMVAIGVLVVVWNLHRRASNVVRRPEDPCITHLKRQYQRQYEALRSVPAWYIGPLIPGVVLLYVAVLIGVAEKAGFAVAIGGLIGPAAITFGIFGAIALLNVWAAGRLKREIAALDALD